MKVLVIEERVNYATCKCGGEMTRGKWIGDELYWHCRDCNRTEMEIEDWQKLAPA